MRNIDIFVIAGDNLIESLIFGFNLPRIKIMLPMCTILHLFTEADDKQQDRFLLLLFETHIMYGKIICIILIC